MSTKIRSINNPKNKDSDFPFNWLIGSWKNKKTDNTYEEWEVNKNQELIGSGYKLIGNDKIISENIKIVAIEGEYYYQATLPHSVEPVSFKIIDISECSFICENSRYDFPKKISYVLNGYDQLVIKLVGFNRSLEFTFEKSGD